MIKKPSALILFFGFFAVAETALSLIFRRQIGDVVPPLFPWIQAFADLLPALAFTLPALFSGKRIWGAFASFSMILILTLKALNCTVYAAMKEPLTCQSCGLLLEHTDSLALYAVFGPHYMLWICLIAAGVLLAVAAILFLTVKNLRAPAGNPARVLLLVLALAALAAGAEYEYDQDLFRRDATMNEYAARPVFRYVSEYFQDAKKEREFQRQPIRPGCFPDRLSAASEALLRREGILPGAAPAHTPDFRRFEHIFVIAVESLDLDFIRACNPKMPADATPYLDRLVKTYPSFTHYFAGAQPTSFGFSSMLLGRPDYRHDLRLRSRSLLRLLADQGFASQYFAPVSGRLFDCRKYYENLFGFDRQFYFEDFARLYNVEPASRWGLDDATLFDCVFKILQAQDRTQKCISFLSTMDMHPGYSRSGPRKNERSGNPFLDALRCTDANLESFLGRLMADPGLFNEKTLVIITADHTATHGANFLKRSVYLPERIPLIFISEPRIEGLPVDKFCSQLDLAPTLLAGFGIPAPETCMGQNILTKRSFALSWTPAEVWLLRRPNQKMISDDLKKKRRTEPLLRAMFEFFDSRYGFAE